MFCMLSDVTSMHHCYFQLQARLIHSQAAAFQTQLAAVTFLSVQHNVIFDIQILYIQRFRTVEVFGF